MKRFVENPGGLASLLNESERKIINLLEDAQLREKKKAIGLAEQVIELSSDSAGLRKYLNEPEVKEILNYQNIENTTPGVIPWAKSLLEKFGIYANQ